VGRLQADFPVPGDSLRRFWPGNWRQDGDCRGDAQDSSKTGIATDGAPGLIDAALEVGKIHI